MSRRFALLVNPASAGGRALKALPAVHAELDRLGAPHRTAITRSIKHAESEAERAADANETIVALSGDGLLRPLASVLRGRDCALALVPCGRGNDLARVLGVPTDPTEAARTAVEGRERSLDVADVDGTPFMGIASFGFDSDANRVANQAKLVRGKAVYLYAAVRALISWRPARFTLTVDNERHEVIGFSAGVANSRAYGGGMFVAPQAELDDALLDVVAVGEISKLRFLVRLLPKVFAGSHLSEPYVHAWRGESIEVASDRPFVIYADGDPIGATPATMRVQARCLRVIVPA